MIAPVFIDAAGAAELLHVPLDRVLDLIHEGRLPTFGGKASNPFVRRVDVIRVGEDLGLGATDEEAPRRVKSASARVQARITADARWADIEEDDIRDWARRADASRRTAAKQAAVAARQRLDTVLHVLNEMEES